MKPASVADFRPFFLRIFRLSDIGQIFWHLKTRVFSGILKQGSQRPAPGPETKKAGKRCSTASPASLFRAMTNGILPKKFPKVFLIRPRSRALERGYSVLERSQANAACVTAFFRVMHSPQASQEPRRRRPKDQALLPVAAKLTVKGAERSPGLRCQVEKGLRHGKGKLRRLRRDLKNFFLQLSRTMRAGLGA